MDFVTSNALERVLEIQTSVKSGTAFTIDHGGAQYLVTARHLLPPSEAHPQVQVSNRHVGSLDLRLDLLPVDPDTADVAVSLLPGPITSDLPLPATSNGLVFSQRLFFLGFPYGLAIEGRGEPRERLAFIKGALFSAMATVDGAHLLYLDAFNNPGFSGGPVVGFSSQNRQLQVCGVVANYRTEAEPIYQGRDSLTAMSVRANTGIMIATDIEHATAAIDRAG